MTQKEKAKAYDEAREKIAVRFGINVAEEIFSEFEDSEDERISKEIIKYLEQTVPHNHRDEVLKSKEWIAWLEKQGGQKPDWSIKEKLMLNDIIETTERSNIFKENYQRELIDWLKSLKQSATRTRME